MVSERTGAGLLIVSRQRALRVIRLQIWRRGFFKPLMLLYKGRTAARPNSRAPPSTYPKARSLGYLHVIAPIIVGGQRPARLLQGGAHQIVCPK
jgi:hypothetical protein